MKISFPITICCKDKKMKTKIIYEDKHILVVYKPAGIAVQSAKPMEMDVVFELKNYLKGAYVGLVHRLDQPVEGILVFAKTPSAAAALSRQTKDGTMEKEYLAAVLAAEGMEERAEKVVLTDYLLKDGKTNTSRVVEASVKNAKKAVLSYEVQKSSTEKIALLKIRLETGRHHQIRVQLANVNLPLLGDLKYGSEESRSLSDRLGIKEVALCACRLVFKHPKTGKNMEFCISPQKESLQNLTV